MVQKIKNILNEYMDMYIKGNIAAVKTSGFYYTMLIDIMFYGRFHYHAFRHLTRDVNSITWNSLFFEEPEKEGLLFYLPLFRDSINKAKLEKKIEEILDDTKTPNDLYKAVEYIASKIEEFNIHEVFKKGS